MELLTFMERRPDVRREFTTREIERWERDNFGCPPTPEPPRAEFDTTDPHWEITETLDELGFYDGHRADFQIRVWRDRAVYVADADCQAKGIGTREFGTDLQIVIERLFAWIDAN